MIEEDVILQSGVQSAIALAPVTRKTLIEIVPPSLADNRADVARVRQALLPVFGNVHIPFRLLVMLPGELRRCLGRLIRAGNC
jgi:hypothetical protein